MYMQNKLLYLCIFIFFCLSACNSMKSEILDTRLEPYSFEPEQVYVLDTSSIPKIDPPNFIFLKKNTDGSIRIAKDTETPDYAALDVNELKKIEAMLTVRDMYKDISKEQESLINIERSKNKVLKEMLTLERQARKTEQQLRLDSEKRYRQEIRDHRLDNILNRGSLILVVIGGIAIAAL